MHLHHLQIDFSLSKEYSLYVYDHNAVKIYTDGSAKPNPGKGGIGMVVEYPDNLNLDNFELSEGYKLSTNNRMELRAIIRVFEWLQSEMTVRRFTRAIIITDSDYVSSNHQNAQYWKTNGWRNDEGKPYENEDLWDTFLRERQKTKLRTEIVWEKGKQNNILLRVDALAKQGADNPTKTDYGYNAGKFTATRTASRKAATLFPAKGQNELIRVYRKSIYGKGEKQIYKITFDLYDREKKMYVEKFVAYRGKDCDDLKRNNCYEVIFNESKTFPVILEATSVEYVS